jgi:hypothetical protein
MPRSALEVIPPIKTFKLRGVKYEAFDVLPTTGCGTCAFEHLKCPHMRANVDAKYLQCTDAFIVVDEYSEPGEPRFNWKRVDG